MAKKKKKAGAATKRAPAKKKAKPARKAPAKKKAKPAKKAPAKKKAKPAKKKAKPATRTKGRRAEPQGPTLIAFVLTPAEPRLDAERVAQAHAELAPSLGPGLTAASGDEGVLSFDLGDVGSLFVAPMPAPIPNDEAEDAARLSLASLGGAPFPEHGGHATVVLILRRPAAPADALRLLSRAVAAVAEAADAVGVYWGPGNVAHPRAMFVDTVRDLGADDLPLPIWCGLSVAAEDGDRMSLLTVGVADQLGVPDLLLSAPRESAAAAVEFAFDLSLYVARRGAPIPEGETVGRNAEERLPVRYVPSPTDPEVQVAAVSLD